MTQSKVRYAVVGLGQIAQAAVLPAFAHARRNSSLHAVVSGSVAKLNEIGEKYQVPVRATYDQYDRCLDEVDAVYLCTPNSEHAEYAVRAARRGVHVLCERPLALTGAECERMITACRHAGVRLMTADRLHLEPLFLEIVELVRAGKIGAPRYFSSSFSMQAQPDGNRTRRQTGGGSLYNLGVYCINTARVMFAAEPVQVFAVSVNGARSGMPDIDETTSAVMQFDAERLATFTTSFDANGVSDFRIVGTHGHIHVEPAYEYAEALGYTVTVGDQSRTKKGRRRDQAAAELAHFSDCVLEGRDPEPSADEGRRDVRVVDALLESARRGTPIALPRLDAEGPPANGQAEDFLPVREAPELAGVGSGPGPNHPKT